MAKNKFRFAFDNAPKSATHFDGSEYSHFDKDTESYILSLSLPECSFIRELNFTPIPIEVIGNIAKMIEAQDN